MNASQHKGKTVLLDGVSKHHDLRDTSRKGRIVFEVMIKGEDSRLKLLADVLESEGWFCEGSRLTLTAPKNAFSSGNREMIRTVHGAIAKMSYLLKVAGVDYEMRIVSEASTKERGADECVAKLKVGLIGDPKVGKTSLVRRFVLDQFDDAYVKTIGAKVSKKEVFIPLPHNRRMRVDMMIWDIIGERNVAELYMESQFKGVQGILAVADMTRRETLDGIGGWTSSVRHVTGNVPVYILANKMDLENALEVERMEVSQYSRRMGCPFTFTSAKTGRNVERAFSELARWILSAKDKKEMAVTTS
ncbi:MAG: GTP-binding protein [Thermoplasmata archaeon]|nr:GTP-binding protein [Thermoplasmata archaeon]